jgi:anti-sigma regulatory factor (Ser/Thr protein kinase)
VNREGTPTEPTTPARPGAGGWGDRPFPSRASSEGEGEEWRFSLEPTEAAPGFARDGIAALALRLTQAQMQDARLLVSELVTNAVVHGGAGNGDESIDVHVRVLPGSAAVCVRDAGAGFVPWELVESRPGIAGHRGLELVALLADRFGIAGRCPFQVWFEVDL